MNIDVFHHKRKGATVEHRVAELVEQFEVIHREVVTFCEALTSDEWETFVPNEERTVGVLMQHIAFGYTVEAALIGAIVENQPLPDIYTDRAILNDWNARDAMELLAGTKDDALRLLDRHARRTARFLRKLSDDDLAKSRSIGLFGGAQWTVEALISRIVLGHPQMHLPSIREALAAQTTGQPS